MNRSHRRVLAHLFVPAIAGLLLSASLQRQAGALPPAGYTLTWSDEFSGAAGSAPNSANWNLDLGAGGWGNGELETYVSDAAHCSLISDPAATDGSALQIAATYSGGIYESARLDSIGNEQPTFGYIEIRAKNPTGQGIWPAFWMLGTDYPDDSWPNCGEQDIMELFANADGTNMSSWHMNYLGNEVDWTSQYTLANGATFNQAYHTFGMLWTQTAVNAYVDGNLFEAHASQSPGWVFNHPYYYILNLAIGGGPPGNPNSSTVFPQYLDVDYVRYYSPPAYTSPGSGTITDPCNDLSVVYNTSGNWIVDDSNPTYFNGDTGRLSRIYNATEFLNYKYPNISAATVTVGTGSANPTAVTLWYSTNNGSTYTEAVNTYSAVTPTTDGWGMYTVSTSGLPTGVTDLQIQEAPTANSWDHQIANVVITSASPTVPAAPVALGAISGSSSVYLSWLGSNGATSYNIYRSTTSGGEGTTPFATGDVPTVDGDLTVSNGTTYYYKVAAVNSAGTSGQSAEMVGNPQGVTTVPSAPTGLTATAGNAQVALAWTASSGATSYNVYRGTTSGGEGTTALATGVTTTTYTNTGLTNGTTYYYTVSAINSGGMSAQSTEASATPSTPSAPSIPTGVSASAGNSVVTVSWNASSGAPTSYSVYRSTSSGGEGTTAYATSTTTSYSDTAVTNGTTYYYKVSAANSIGTSAQSAEVSATPVAGGGTTSGPVSINCGGSAASPFLADADFSGGTTGSTTSSIATGSVSNPPPPQAVLESWRTGTMTYTLPGFSAGTNAVVQLYFMEPTATGSGQREFDISINGNNALTNFDIYANTGGQFKAIQENFNATVNIGGQVVIAFTNGSAGSPIIAGIAVSGTAGSGGSAPSAPTGLTATPGNAQVALSWTASSGATSYNVYRGTSSGGEGSTAIATGITATTFTNTGLANGTTYYYKVAAVDAAGTSAQSTEASATPQIPVPGVPTGLTATAGNAQVVLSWTAGSNATSYNVYRGASSGSEGSTAIATGITTTTFTNTGLTNGSTYYYKVAAVDAAGTSAQSTEASATPAGSATSGSASINCGGSASSPFVADTDFSGGTTGSTTATINTSILSNPPPAQAVLQTYRQGVATYTMGGFTAGSNHVLSLYFSEPTYTAPRQRMFNVAINGTTVLSSFDIYGNTNAQNKGIQENFNATATSAGQIVISLTAVTSNPIIQAIVAN